MQLKTNGRSITATLTAIISSVLPNFKHTGLAKHLRGVSNEPKSKGKAVLFKWNNTTFKASDSLSVSELSFCNTWEKTQDAVKIEAALKTFHESMTTTEITERNENAATA